MNGISSVQSSPGLILIGMAALVAVKFFYYDRSEEPEDALHLAMNVVGRTMIAIGIVEGCVFALSWFALVLVVVAGVVAEIAKWRYRASRRTALLVTMATAADRFMPLGPAVEAFAGEWRGGFRRDARELARALDAGTPLVQALRRTPELVPPKALSMIEAGQEAGVLGAAIGEAARLSLPKDSLDKATRPIWYLLDMLIVTCGVLGFLFVKILPAFSHIFEDFDAQLPLGARQAVACSAFLVDYYYVAIPAALPLAGAAIYFVLRYFGVVAWEPPLVARMSRRIDTAAVLQLLAAATAAGRPLEPALAAFARNFPNQSLRRKLQRVRDDAQQGADVWQSMRGRGLLSAQEAAMIESAVRVGNLPWMLRETASGIERKVAYRLQIAGQFAMPATALACGAVMFAIIVGFFSPLVALTEKLL